MIEVYTDGASRGNPGLSGAGVYIKANGNTEEYAYPLGTLSNHEAEFYAVIKALTLCQSLYSNEIISLRSDSQVLVDTFEKNFTKNNHFAPLLKQMNDLKQTFPYVFMKWIPSKTNYHADRLAKEAIHMNV